MKNQPYFLRKIKVKKIKCRLLHFCLALQGLKYETEQTTKHFVSYQ